jgi:hypothetical protein
VSSRRRRRLPLIDEVRSSVSIRIPDEVRPEQTVRLQMRTPFVLICS